MAGRRYSEVVKAAAESLLADGNLNFLQKLDNSKNDNEKFSLIWNNDQMREMLSPSLVKSEKSELEADRLRNEGNSFYKKRNFVKALELYNQSIRHAPHPVVEALTQQGEPTCDSDFDSYEYPIVDPKRYGGTVKGGSETLAKGYSNRSALLYEIKCYDKCLADIDLAFEIGCSEDLGKRLTSRKEKCLETLKKNLSLKSDLCDVLSRLQQVLSDKLGDNVLQCVPNQEGESVYRELNDNHLVDILSLETSHLPSLKETNPSYPTLNSGVTLAYIPTKGRGIVTSKDFRPGEIIGIERSPFIYVDCKNLDTYCSYCLQLCLTPVPCPSCCQVIYCGKLCRSKCLSEDHWLQCTILPTLISLGISNMVYLILMKCLRFSQLKEMVLKLREEKVTLPEMAGCNSNGVYSSTSYQVVHHLHQQPTTNIHPAEKLEQLQMAVTITSLLLESGRFFLNEQFERVIPSQEDIILTGSVIYSFIMKSAVNGMYVLDSKLKKTIGGGIFPTLSLLNNACNANAQYNGDGRTLQVTARRWIKAGEEVTIPYVSDYIRLEPKDRHMFLLKSGVDCKCEACVNGWPIMEHQPQIYCKCLNCSKEVQELGWICKKCVKDMAKKGEFYNTAEIIRKNKELDGYLRKLDTMQYSLKEKPLLTEKEVAFVLEAADELCKYLLEPCRILSVIMSLISSTFPYIPDKRHHES